MEELERFVEKQDFDNAVKWINYHIDDYYEYSTNWKFMKIVCLFDRLCLDYINLAFGYDECKRLMKETINLLVNVGK